MNTTNKAENRAEELGKACYDGIKDMFTRLDGEKNDEKQEEILTEIDESNYGVNIIKNYSIILAGGGPAVRIYGELDDNGMPYSADLQYQDWLTEWQRLPGVDEDLLVRYAEKFIFGN